ncbi:MAG TPA: hypothetical protein VLH18_05175 [Candidatus Limnocylindrales bacterium]|nr:hypothetical protein [Candidatus Limnocylindrales bacterium]
MTDEMTPRERVLTAFEHREPDRVPIDFASTHNSGINVLATMSMPASMPLTRCRSLQPEWTPPG